MDKIQEFIEKSEMVPVDGRVLKISEFFKQEDFITAESNIFIKLDALVRVSRKILGRLIYSDSNIIQPPNKANDWCAVVKVTQTFINGDEKHYSYSALADCRKENAPKGGAGKYLTCLAESRAISRVLRNLLGLPICSYEEIVSEEDIIKTDVPIEVNQKLLIEKKFFSEKSRNMEHVNKILGKEIESLNELTKEEASKVIEGLNKIK